MRVLCIYIHHIAAIVCIIFLLLLYCNCAYRRHPIYTVARYFPPLNRPYTGVRTYAYALYSCIMQAYVCTHVGIIIIYIPTYVVVVFKRPARLFTLFFFSTPPRLQRYRLTSEMFAEHPSNHARHQNQ